MSRSKQLADAGYDPEAIRAIYKQEWNDRGGRGWSFLGLAAMVAVTALVVTNLPDIKRYIRISTM